MLYDKLYILLATNRCWLEVVQRELLRFSLCLQELDLKKEKYLHASRCRRYNQELKTKSLTKSVCLTGIHLHLDSEFLSRDGTQITVRNSHCLECKGVWAACASLADGASVPRSCPTFAAPWTAAHQAPLSTGFTRQEHWSVCCHFLLQGIFLTQGLNLGLPHPGRWILYHLSHRGLPLVTQFTLRLGFHSIHSTLFKAH